MTAHVDETRAWLETHDPTVEAAFAGAQQLNDAATWVGTLLELGANDQAWQQVGRDVTTGLRAARDAHRTLSHLPTPPDEIADGFAAVVARLGEVVRVTEAHGVVPAYTTAAAALSEAFEAFRDDIVSAGLRRGYRR